MESFVLGKLDAQTNDQKNGETLNNLDPNQEAEIIDTDNESMFKKILKNFNLIEHNHKDKYLGNVGLFRCIHNKAFHIYLREMFTKSEEELNQQMEHWTRRMKELKHPNIIQLHGNISKNNVNIDILQSKGE